MHVSQVRPVMPMLKSPVSKGKAAHCVVKSAVAFALCLSWRHMRGVLWFDAWPVVESCMMDQLPVMLWRLRRFLSCSIGLTVQHGWSVNVRTSHA
jgi:hypothetical protein